MRLSLRFLPLILGALLASAGHAPARAAGDDAGAPLHLDDASLPDPTKSPGDFSRDLDAADLCETPIEDFAKAPPKALCDDVFEESRLPADYRFQYACVFLVPPAIGGTQSRTNVWLQPAAEASLKASADAAARRHICKYPADLAEAQRFLAANWVGAYRKYLLPGDKLAPIANLEHGPDDFGLLPPAPAEEGGTSSGGAYGYDSSYGYGDGGGGDPGSDDRRRQRRGSLQDDRRRQHSGPGERNEGAGRPRDTRAPWLRDRDDRRRDEAGRGADGRDGAGLRPKTPRDGAPQPGDGRPKDEGHRGEAGRDPGGHDGVGPRPATPHDGARPGDGRPDDGGYHDEAGRRPDEGDGRGRHSDVPGDGRRPGDGRPDDGGRETHSHDHRDGRDFGSRGGDRDGYHHSEGPRPDDPHRSFGGQDADWRHRQAGFPSRGPENRGFGFNRPFEHGDGRFPPSRFAGPPGVRPTDVRPADVRPNDVRPNDVRPNDVRPNDVRPTRPGLGRPRYPGPTRHTGGHRGGGRRR